MTYWFDERAAVVVERFFERTLLHTVGEWAGRPFVLEGWQRQIVRDVFGWKREADGLRRYRRVYIEIPRKNGKSTLAAGLALYMLLADGEAGAQVYSVAADRDQAAIVFDQARLMVERSPYLAREAQVYKRSIVQLKTASSYKVLSADVPTKHGLNASAIIFDELHAQPNRDLWDVMTTSQASRRQPLLVAITTAGYDRTSICWEQHEYARQVAAGIVEDPEQYVFIAAAESEDDWTLEETWRKANPNYGVSVKPDYLAAEAARAQQTPAYQNTFRRLHLNQWTQQLERWLDMTAWDRCDVSFTESELAGRRCYGGLDLASSSDVAAFVMVFPLDDDRYAVLPRFWIPRENMIERARRDRVPYDAWVRDGHMQATDGDVIDFGVICRDIEALGQRFDIREIAFDRWGAVQVSQTLSGAGFEMVQFGQGFASMAAPTKELLRLVLSRSLAHGGQPVLRWMADNMTVQQDPAGNVKPDKKKSREKIDGIVALIMGLDRATRHGNGGRSVYEDRGLLTL